MDFKTYLQGLNELAKKHPESLNKEVVFANDNESNGYSPLIYSPSLGKFENGEFQSMDVQKIKTGNPAMLNAVCVN